MNKNGIIRSSVYYSSTYKADEGGGRILCNQIETSIIYLENGEWFFRLCGIYSNGLVMNYHIIVSLRVDCL